MRNQKFSVHFLKTFAIYFDDIQCDATNCWFVEAHAKFILH